MVMLRCLSRAPAFLAFPAPLLLFALNPPCRLAAVANALLGMDKSDLLLLLLPAHYATWTAAAEYPQYLALPLDQ
jgi:hypothetical protein